MTDIEFLARLEADFRHVEYCERYKLPVDGFPNAHIIKLRARYRQP